jgi:GNAT superfamily N-acetyltransferase
MIRKAGLDDLPELVRLGKAFHERMVYNTRPFNAASFEAALTGYVEADSIGVWVGDKAMAVAMIGTHPATGHVMASELMLYSEGARQGLALLKAMKNWAKEKGASDLILTDQMNMRDLAALYERVGAHPVERVYRAEL